MEVVFTECVAVTDESSVGAVRRSAMLAAQRLDFNDTQSGELALLATEASRNVLVHGGGGQVVLTGCRHQRHAAARILAMDKGPGIKDLALAMSDGFSTAGTMGGGLGAMKRMAGLLEVFSGRGGTIVLLQVGQAVIEGPVEVAGIAVPYPGEQRCGDAWTCESHAGANRGAGGGRPGSRMGCRRSSPGSRSYLPQEGARQAPARSSPTSMTP